MLAYGLSNVLVLPLMMAQCPSRFSLSITSTVAEALK